jgi:hypothetical protein
LRAPGLISFGSRALFVGLAAFWAAGSAAQAPRPVGLALSGMSYVLASGERSELVVEAQRAEVSPATGRIALTGVRAKLPGALELECAHGVLDLAAQEFFASGGAVGRTAVGSAFETERLRYAHARGVVTSDAPVVWRERAQVFRGRGLEYFVRQGRLRLLGGASISEEAP